MADLLDFPNPTGAVWLNDNNGISHCVPYSHPSARQEDGDTSSPIFRPPLCSDKMFDVLGMGAGPASLRPCSECSQLLRLGHWRRTPGWPIDPAILRDGFKMMERIWGVGSNPQRVISAEEAHAKEAALLSKFLQLCEPNLGSNWQEALSKSGIRSVVNLGRISARLDQVDRVKNLVPRSKHPSIGRGATQAQQSGENQ